MDQAYEQLKKGIRDAAKDKNREHQMHLKQKQEKARARNDPQNVQYQARTKIAGDGKVAVYIPKSLPPPIIINASGTKTLKLNKEHLLSGQTVTHHNAAF
jgi:hypothetical protein